MGGFSYIDPGASGLDLFSSSVAQGVATGQEMANQREAEQRRRMIQDREMAMKEEDFRSVMGLREQQARLNDMMMRAQEIENNILEATQQDEIDKSRAEYEKIAQEIQANAIAIADAQRQFEREGRRWSVNEQGQNVYTPDVGSEEEANIRFAQTQADLAESLAPFQLSAAQRAENMGQQEYDYTYGGGLAADLNAIRNGEQPSANYYVFGGQPQVGSSGGPFGGGSAGGGGRGTSGGGSATTSSGVYGGYITDDSGNPVTFDSYFSTASERERIRELVSIVQSGQPKTNEEGEVTMTPERAAFELDIANVDPSTGLMLAGTPQLRARVAEDEEVARIMAENYQKFSGAYETFQGAFWAGQNQADSWEALKVMSDFYDPEDPQQVALYEDAKRAYETAYGELAPPPPAGLRGAGVFVRKGVSEAVSGATDRGGLFENEARVVRGARRLVGGVSDFLGGLFTGR